MKKLLSISAVLALIIGILLLAGGIWGIAFTYKSVAQEKIITAEDASIPNKPVRGPFTLKSQAEAIRGHVLKMTDGKTYAEMPRQIPKLDSSGKPVLDEKGEPVMVSNDARNIWITATTLITALNLAIMGYVVSGLVLGLVLIVIGGGLILQKRID